MEKMKENKNWEYGAFALIGIGLILILASFFADFMKFGGKFDLDLADKYGSYIQGVVGTLFVLASTLLFYSALREQKKATELQMEELKLQRQELVFQRDELKLQRKEIENSREVLVAQLQTSKDHLNNDVFFKLLNNFDNAVNNVRLSMGADKEPLIGLHAIKYLAVRYYATLNQYNKYKNVNNTKYNERHKEILFYFEYIKKENDSIFIQLFKLLIFKYNFVLENVENVEQMAYFRNIIKNTTDDYIKFIISIYYIHTEEENVKNYTITLIHKNNILDRNDFKNLIIGEEFHNDFMNLIFTDNIES